MRDRFEATLLEKLPHIYINGKRDQRLPNTSNIAFDFVEAEAILLKLDLQGICSSSGSACTTGSLDPSHVLSAMGLTPARSAQAAFASPSVITIQMRKSITL